MNHRYSAHHDRRPFARLRERLARLLAPTVGDEKTERHETVIIERDSDEYHVRGYATADTTQTADFDRHVDIVTVNGEPIHFNDELCLGNGVAFEYYWGVDRASIDLLQ